MLASPIRALLLAGTLALAACGGGADAATRPPDAPAVAGMCAEDTPDCVDVVVDPDGDCGPHGCGTEDEVDVDRERREARDLLGEAESELPAEVRVARRGDETYALTEDYVVGRDTVELEADADGTFWVVLVTVELPEGPETYAAE